MPYGTVKEIKGNIAVVSMERQDMCGDCHACEMMSGKKNCTLSCVKKVPCEVGDKVEVTLTTDYFLKATYLVYGVPLLGFVIGLGLGVVLSKAIQTSYSDLWIALCILLGTGAGVLYIKMRDKKKAYGKFLPSIIENKGRAEKSILK